MFVFKNKFVNYIVIVRGEKREGKNEKTKTKNMNYLLNIENWLLQPKSRVGNGYTLTAEKMKKDLGDCNLFRLLDAEDYPLNWNDISIAHFKRLKLFYMIDENADVSELENTIKIRFEDYKLKNPDYYLITDLQKTLAKKLK